MKVELSSEDFEKVRESFNRIAHWIADRAKSGNPTFSEIREYMHKVVDQTV